MNKYVTRKALTVELTKNFINISDSIGCSLKIKNRGKYYINGLIYKYKDVLLLEYVQEMNGYSVIVENSNLFVLLEECIQLCSDIEYLLIQRGTDVNIYDLIKLDVVQSSVESENLSLRLDKDKYEKILRHFEKVKDIFIIQQNMRYLFELVRSEIYHAENCIVEIIKLLQDILILKKDDIHNNEIIYTGVLGDKVGWYITDCVKALATSLDGLSKALHYIDDFRINGKIKKPKVLSSDLCKVKKFHDDPKFMQYVDGLNELILLRHDLTHNQLFYPVRQRVFIGSGKTQINDHKFAYADILMYDFKDGAYTKSPGVEGFFSMKRDTISFLHKSLFDVYSFFKYCISSVYDGLILEAKESNIKSFLTFDHAKASLKLENKDYYKAVLIE